MTSSSRRLGVYVDGPFRICDTTEGRVVATHPSDFPFLVFLDGVARHFDRVVLFARAEAVADPGDYVPIPPSLEIAELPFYAELSQLGAVAAALPGTIRGFWRALAGVDRVWVLGPHPLGLILVLLAALRRRRVVLGVRQDTLAYFEPRLPTRRWRVVLPALRALDASFRLLARRLETVVVGSAIAAEYGGEGPRVLVMADSLVRERDVAAGPKEQSWDGTIELLAASRIDPDKSPLLLVEALARLEREEPGRYRLTWAGGGPLFDAVRDRADELGVGRQLELRGWIPFGPELLELYTRAHVFVRVSLQEGVPRVLYEAMARATPIVASDVGGVRHALDDGRAGLLVPPDDLDALVAAVRSLAGDAELRSDLVTRGLQLVRDLTLDVQARRVAGFLAAGPD
jgi:glycosyltransferase involved in cell wall biosynthesis